MNNRPVPLNLRKSVALPQAVVIPLSMHSKLGVERRLLIQSRTQPVPVALREWLRNDKRYARWFEEEPITAEPQQTEVSPPPNGGEDGRPNEMVERSSAQTTPTGDETGSSRSFDGQDGIINRVTSTQQDAPTAEQWYEGMTVPVLRDYAKRFDIELTSEDLKADVVDKLRTARGDFEWKPPQTEEALPKEGTSE